jgi:hypothetical protein
MAFVLTPGHRHEQTAFRELMQRGAVKRRGPGRPKLRPRTVLGDMRAALTKCATETAAG